MSAIPPSWPGHYSQLLWCAAGDLLGPLGFALTLQPLVERIKAEMSGLPLNVWYLNDGTLVGPPDALTAALCIVERDGRSLGLNLNRSKSLLFIPKDSDPSLSTLPPQIPVIRQRFSLLRCPIGPPDYCEEIFQSRLEKVKCFLTALNALGDSQLETSLLRLDSFFPRFPMSAESALPATSATQLRNSIKLFVKP